MSSVDQLWSIYRSFRDRLENTSSPHINLVNPKKRKILSDLSQKEINYSKFFLANISLRNKFYLTHIPFEKSMRYYYQFDEWIEKNYREYYKIVLNDVKKLVKIDLDDRDKFLELFTKVNWRVWSVVYLELSELINSIEDEQLIEKIIRGNMIMEKMPKFDKLREKVRGIVL